MLQFFPPSLDVRNACSVTAHTSPSPAAPTARTGPFTTPPETSSHVAPLSCDTRIPLSVAAYQPERLNAMSFTTEVIALLASTVCATAGLAEAAGPREAVFVP